MCFFHGGKLFPTGHFDLRKKYFLLTEMLQGVFLATKFYKKQGQSDLSGFKIKVLEINFWVGCL